MSRVDFDEPEPHHPIPPHSCKHCQRIVLRREHFIQLPSWIKLPHTKTELRQAIKDRCELILLFASPEQPEHLLVCSGCSDCEDSLRSLWGPEGIWIELDARVALAPRVNLTFKHKDLFKMRFLPSIDMDATGVTGVLSSGRTK